MNFTNDKNAEEGLLQTGCSGSGGLLKCEDMQLLLSAYLMRELGDVQSRVVREHLRTCDACRREAAELQEMLNTLEAVGGGEREGARLSDERRVRLWRAVFHPVWNWIYIHHRLVSAVLAVLALITVLVALRHTVLFRTQPPEESIPIWRMFRSGQLPELVEKARLQRLNAPAEVSPVAEGETP